MTFRVSRILRFRAGSIPTPTEKARVSGLQCSVRRLYWGRECGVCLVLLPPISSLILTFVIEIFPKAGRAPPSRSFPVALCPPTLSGSRRWGNEVMLLHGEALEPSGASLAHAQKGSPHQCRAFLYASIFSPLASLVARVYR